MDSYSVEIDCSKIKDEDSFHDVFAREFGFFDGYGRNMDAWIDCLGDMYTDGEYQSLSRFSLNSGDEFNLVLIHSDIFKEDCPVMYEKLLSCINFIGATREYSNIRLHEKST